MQYLTSTLEFHFDIKRNVTKKESPSNYKILRVDLSDGIEDGHSVGIQSFLNRNAASDYSFGNI